MKIIERNEEAPQRPGYRSVFLMGRNYPSAELAVAALRRALAKDGIEVPDDDIGAVHDMPGAICPYSAWAIIPG